VSAVSIDHAARTEELAQDLARYPRITLARFIAERFMEDARRGAFGNIALKTARKASTESFAIFASEQAAADSARRAEARAARAARRAASLWEKRPAGASPEAPASGRSDAEVEWKLNQATTTLANGKETAT